MAPEKIIIIIINFNLKIFFENRTSNASLIVKASWVGKSKTAEKQVTKKVELISNKK